MLLVSTSIHAQFVDSIKLAIATNSPKLYGSFDTRNSFVTNHKVQMASAKLGVRYGNTFVAGLAYTFIYDKVYASNTSFNSDRLKARYVSLLAEYTFYENHRWEFSIPLQIGVGKLFYQNELTDAITSRSAMFVYEPTMNGTFKITRWFGVGANVGYRIVFKSNKVIDDRLTSPIYAVGMSFFFGTIYRDLRKVVLKK